jgi:hypothetical protein
MIDRCRENAIHRPCRCSLPNLHLHLHLFNRPFLLSPRRKPHPACEQRHHCSPTTYRRPLPPLYSYSCSLYVHIQAQATRTPFTSFLLPVFFAHHISSCSLSFTYLLPPALYQTTHPLAILDTPLTNLHRSSEVPLFLCISIVKSEICIFVGSFFSSRTSSGVTSNPVIYQGSICRQRHFTVAH